MTFLLSTNRSVSPTSAFLHKHDIQIKNFSQEFFTPKLEKNFFVRAEKYFITLLSRYIYSVVKRKVVGLTLIPFISSYQCSWLLSALKDSNCRDG